MCREVVEIKKSKTGKWRIRNARVLNANLVIPFASSMRIHKTCLLVVGAAQEKE